LRTALRGAAPDFGFGDFFVDLEGFFMALIRGDRGQAREHPDRWKICKDSKHRPLQEFGR
jgi:hypothetical protein